MKNNIVVFRSQRSDLLDGLKGFALLGGLLLTYVQHFLYPYFPNGADTNSWFWAIDKSVYRLVVALFEMKILGFFALLFGVSFNYLYSKRRAKNHGFWQQNIWRLYILAGIGLFIAMLMPNGGGLFLIACMGFLLSLIRQLSRKTILIFIAIGLLQPLTWMQYLWSLIDGSFIVLAGRQTSLYEHLSMLATIDKPLVYFSRNFVEGLWMSTKLFIISGFPTVIFSLMLIGYWLSRKSLLNHVGYNREWWVRCLQVSMAGVIVFGLLGYNIEAFVSENNLTKVLLSVLGNWVDVALIMALLSGFIIMFKSDRYPKINSAMVVYGRMSLTNFVLQSVIGVFVFLPVGLHLAQYCGAIVSLLIAGVVFAALVWLSWWWQHRFARGPLEYLVHRLTWL